MPDMVGLGALSVLDVTLAALGVALVSLILSGKRKGPLPPGPKGWPIIGNVLDMPSSYQWKTYTQWAEKWGDIISVTLLGQPIVVVSSLEHATELLERRSTLYSDRPILTVGGKIVGWDQIVVLTPYGPRFREARRLLSRWIGSRSSVARFAPMLQHETSKYLLDLRRSPEQFVNHIKKSAAAIILTMTYGYQIKGDKDPLIEIVDRAMAQFTVLTTPGTFLADIFPSLEHVPSWVPGTGWKQRALGARQDTDAMLDVPYSIVEKEMAAGTATPSFLSVNIEGNPDPTEEFQSTLKTTAGVLYAGGSDTTVSTLHSFFLAMACYPEIQKKAQQEIDAVIGNDRLPTLADQDSLPYVNAVCAELHRWNPVAPLGVTHRLVQDDVYAGYFFPKGTLITVNAWKILHDPETYKNPLDFNPGRFMGTEPETDPRPVAFGFGRRICPGLNFADASIFLSCAMMLAVFDVSKAVEYGRVIEPVVEYTSGQIRISKPSGPVQVFDQAPVCEG
ncbi:uncharacterized protein FIBRA_03251 [Fibroporia radiculosa]|uniref:Cytochrome P450 n=1 Tax=Fibroporia radiculosa TaxID=599839 RepID=J4G4R5_9APHY|nr:uncharacterized protein FIBRA_03251 [Fibroporia radiculosa]CCM01203.1 predicted protein [Fibroporia radiculosa]